jgi:type III secretory pathway component EscV
MIDPQLEAMVRQKVADAKRAGVTSSMDGLVLPVEILEPFLEKLHKLARTKQAQGQTLVIVTSADLRRRMRNFLAANNINIPVLSPHEISSDVNSFPIDIIQVAKNVSEQESRRPNAASRRPRARA